MGRPYSYRMGSLTIVANVAEYDACGIEDESHLIIFAPNEESAAIAFDAIAERACDSKLQCVGVVPQEYQPATGSTTNPAVVIVTWIIAEGQPKDIFDRVFRIIGDYNAIKGNPVFITTVKHAATSGDDTLYD